MQDVSATLEPTSSREEFAALLDEQLGRASRLEGTVLRGTVVAIDGEEAIVDVGLKSEGRIPLKEFAPPGQTPEVKVGDVVEVYVERYENRSGEIVLSREKARREESWNRLERAFQEGTKVEGVIFGKVKGGFAVDLGGAVAFLPGSQVDIRPVRDIGPLLNKPEPFMILKMDRRRGNIVVSRRAVLEESRAEQRSELLANLREGQVLEGVVKNITDYGAFVDLGGLDGLLHVTDISWRRVNHPADVLQIGQTVKVQVIRFNRETQRISLGMKQLEADPWEGIELKYPVGAKFKGRVTNITDYGAFVELEPGVEGLVHVSEMSWTKKNAHPGKIVSTSQEVEVMVLEVDPEKRRISLGIKQCQPNPWEVFAEKHPVGSIVEGEIKNITEFGLFIGLEGDIDGMVHLSDLSWDQPGEEAVKAYKKGDVVKAVVLDVDVEKERVSLGIKQLTADPFKEAIAGLKKGDRVTCTVKEVTPAGIEVETVTGARGFIKRSDLSRDRDEQRPDRFAVGEKVDAKVMNIDALSRRLILSIKALEIEDERQAMAEYGSADSGASLGEILGAAIRQKQAEEQNKQS
ncbi:MAG: 30S ribosomal protein S1 [Geminicoccaceae bacterium]|nr:30S ribosomal protein S1 [Geminicoccaceae bacterium]MCS7269359.1 30S ribosomal protein S1 [Geminicoccaceae bacterium]MCX7629847.1 30S ribosomal protein S1 [Geminicoccaceae bacterium]MDW8126070.1 30S ribosomal protein S1 [Geminicoccaceae bacterium]MDW8340878.1 30S ribosomal protein S1 [Geminicoccaceae bacterium]